MPVPREHPIFVPVEVRPSPIFGRGLFARAALRRGTVVCSFTTDAKLIAEDEYLDAVRANRYVIVRTGTRYVGRYFTYTEQTETDVNFFNHSFDPNLLVHCGVVIARRDVVEGDELTIDYRYLIDDTDTGVYHDAVTGQPIRGFSARETLLHTTRQLLELIDALPADWQGGPA